MDPALLSRGSMEHRIPGARDRRLSQQDPGYAASGERHDESAEIRSSTPRPTDQPLELNGWLSRSAPTSLVKSWLRAAPGTKINSSNPPLTAVGTPYPAEPLLRLLHPIVQPTSVRPCGHIHLDRRINCTAISVAVLAWIEIHTCLWKAYAVHETREPRDQHSQGLVPRPYSSRTRPVPETASLRLSARPGIGCSMCHGVMDVKKVLAGSLP